MKTMYLQTAYGRTYKNATACSQDWEDGKDFRIVGGPYCSNRDIKVMQGMGVTHLAFYFDHIVPHTAGLPQGPAQYTLDIGKHQFEVGQLVRVMESRRLGRVQELLPNYRVKVDFTEFEKLGSQPFAVTEQHYLEPGAL